MQLFFYDTVRGC